MTRMDKFLALFPNATLEDGVPAFFPCELDRTLMPDEEADECERAINHSCLGCAHQFWSQEVE